MDPHSSSDTASNAPKNKILATTEDEVTHQSVYTDDSSGEESSSETKSDQQSVDLQISPRHEDTQALIERLRANFVQNLNNRWADLQKIKDDHAKADQGIRSSPPSEGRFWAGAATGGCLAYVVSFYSAKLLTLGLSEGLGKQADWAFAPLAGVLHATAGEAIGGGVRATHATYQSPDGMLFANLVSAMCDCVLYTVGGHAKRRRRAMQHLQKALKNIQESLDKRLGKDPKRSSALAAFGAWWRSVVCDELSFFAFAISYLGSGSLRPTLRRIDDRSTALAGEFLVVLGAGLAGGLFTCVIQNALRKWLQRGEHSSGVNDNLTRGFQLQLLEETCKKLRTTYQLVSDASTDYLATLSGTGDNAKDAETLADLKDQVTKLLNKIEETLETFQEITKNLEKQEGLVATGKAICATGDALFCSPANATTPWMNRAGKWRRLLAKSIGNTAVVLSYLYYVNEVASKLHPIHVSTAGNHTDVPQPEPFQPEPFPHGPFTPPPLQHTPIGSGEMAAYAMHGFVLIGAWCTRSLVNTITEVGALSVVPGLALRLGTTATSIWKWARSTDTTVPVNENPTQPGAESGSNNASGDGDGSGNADDGSGSSTVGTEVDPGENDTPSTTRAKRNNLIIDDDDDDDDDDQQDNAPNRSEKDNVVINMSNVAGMLNQASNLVTDADTIINFLQHRSTEKSTSHSAN